MTRRRVLYVQYTNPAAYPPLEHSAWLLAEAGFEVRFLGTAILGDALSLRPHKGIETRLVPYRVRGWQQKLHYVRFVVHALVEVLAWRPSWVYASDPLSCPTALLLSWMPGVRVVYHEHDSPSRELAHGLTGSRFMRMVMSARRSIARRCDVCVLPNDQRAAAFREDTGASCVVTVWNCPMLDEVRIQPHISAGAGLRVFYHGSIVPARLPETVIEALSQLPSAVSLTFAGYETAGHPGYAKRLLDVARQKGVVDRVRFIGTIQTREDLLRACADSDVGLALMPAASSDINEQAMVGASNKPFDYLACGIPIVVSDLPDWRETYVESGFGRSCDPRSPSSIASALRFFLDHPEQRVAIGERGRAKIQNDWNYENWFRPVATRLEARVADWPRRLPTADSVR